MTFREVQLQDVLDVQWGDTKTTKASYVPNGYLAYSAAGPDGFLTDFDYDSDGVVLSAIGANCGTTYYASGKWSCIKNTIRIFTKTDDIDLKYFYYMTKMPNFWPVRGSAQPFISQTDIRELFVRIPDLKVQRAIGRIFHDLEKLVSLNEAISRNLAEAAQAIFKSWFIDFEPVKARMLGQRPEGMSDEIITLFPDSMQESEDGIIPAGWTMGVVSDICESVSSGSTPLRSNSQFWEDGEINWFKTGELSDNFLFDSKESITEAALEKTGVKLLPRGAVLMAIYAAPTVGRLGILTKPSTFNQACTGMVARRDFGAPYLYLNLYNEREWFNSLAIGAAQQNISKGVVESCPTILATKAVHDAFLDLTAPLFAQMETLSGQNLSISELRDSILPRLISGELQIPEEMLAS